MNRLRIHVFFGTLVSILLNIEIVHADVLSKFDLSLEVSGQVTSDFTPLPPKTVTLSRQVPFNSTAGFSVQATALQNTGFSTQGADLNVRGFIANQDLGVGLFLDSTAVDPYGTTKINFQWTTTDTWSLVSNRVGSVLPAVGLQGNFVFQATASVEGANNSVAGGPFDFDVFTGVGFETLSIGNNFITNGNTVDVDTAFGVEWSDPGQSNGEFSIVFRSIFEFSGDVGRMEIDALNTLEFVSITFDDGSTPEDHGFDIVFGSARRSPNIPASVPEPSTCGLFAAGGVALVLRHRRKRKAARVSRESHKASSGKSTSADNPWPFF